MSSKTSKNKKKRSSKGTRVCRRCGTHKAIIRSYDLMICRRCFRETANQIGFKKYD
ncbi:MAG: 30S ribosomal protein S14 [archaeon]|nr:30S ribosomal protein S14 [archaeon]